MSCVDQRRGRELTASERAWIRVRTYLRRHRDELGQAAAEQYPEVVKVAGTALLSRPDWLPTTPIPLDAIDLEFAPDTPFHGLAGTDPVTAAVRPVRPDGSRYPTYSAALADLAAPTVFENRSTYRLLDAGLSGARGRLRFGRGSYFDGIDLGEAAAHEYAAAQLDGGDKGDKGDKCDMGNKCDRGDRGDKGARLRTALGDPCDPARHPTNIAIAVLTIRHDRATGEATFLLHWRDPAKVGHAGGLSMIVPVGVFQASDDQPGHERQDFSLWRCMIREYAEELLGEPERRGSGGQPIDYDGWPLAARMTGALAGGRIRAHVLGLGVDPLTLATDLLTVVVIDAPLFDELFADLVDTNAEGHFVGINPARPSDGFPFTADQLERIAEQPVQAAGSAALRLAWRHWDRLRLPAHRS